jgi:glycosyltransferase involved in cell wall biosynthesis
MVDLWGYAPSKVKVAYHGVDIRKFSPGVKDEKLLRELGMNASDIAIVATARFAREKCLDRLIDAFDGIAHEFPSAHH